MVFDTYEHDFGTLDEGDAVTHIFHVHQHWKRAPRLGQVQRFLRMYGASMSQRTHRSRRQWRD